MKLILITLACILTAITMTVLTFSVAWDKKKLEKAPVGYIVDMQREPIFQAHDRVSDYCEINDCTLGK